MTELFHGHHAVWIPVYGYEGIYEVCNWGLIRSVDRIVQRELWGKIITQRVNGKVLVPAPNRVTGHMTVALSKNGTATSNHVHVLVAAAFIGPRPDGYQVCHNDGIPANNWAWNLRYDTPVGNALDRHVHGTDARGINNPSAKFTEEQVIDLINQMTIKTLAQISRETGIHPATLSSIKTGVNWSYLPRPWNS